jgi:hypothetical protein
MEWNRMEQSEIDAPLLKGGHTPSPETYGQYSNAYFANSIDTTWSL